MLPRSLWIILLSALASCGARNDAARQVNEPSATKRAQIAKFSLTSEAFREGQLIPTRYTCDGTNEVPPLHWSDPPQGAKSFALVIDDPDAPGGMFRHWGVYDIPASARAIANGHPIGREVTNDFGKAGYSGPCPPPRSSAHHYHFRLFALATDHLSIGAGAKVADVERSATDQAIAQGELVGIYGRR